MAGAEDIRTRVEQELLSTEETYVREMTVLIEVCAAADYFEQTASPPDAGICQTVEDVDPRDQTAAW